MKFSLLGIFLIMLMSVAVAADVSEDTISDVETTQIIDTQIVDTVTDEVSSTNDNNVDSTESQLRHIPGDEYTFANETLDIGDNNYDGHTLTLLDNVNVISSNNILLNGTSFVVTGNNVNITGLNIVNNNVNPVVIKVTGSEVNIKNNEIQLTNTVSGETRAISMINTNKVTILGNTINVAAYPQAAGWDNSSGVWVNTMKVSGIKAESSHDITIKNNEITLTKSILSGEENSTADAITIKTCNDILAENNTIIIDGSDYLYGISVTDYSNNIDIYNNTITLTGTNYICGVQFSSTTNSKTRFNKVTGTCTAESGGCPSKEAFAYGVIILTGTWGAPASESTGNTIESNNVTLDSTIAYAYELSNADYTTITNNNATVTGNVVMALGIYNSSYNGITGNRFIVSGSTVSLDSGIYEAIYPVTTGIKINETSYSNTITGNYVEVTDDEMDNIYSVILIGTANTVVSHNELYANLLYGTTSVYFNSTVDIVIDNND